jgi:hypothetical protein
VRQSVTEDEAISVADWVEELKHRFPGLFHGVLNGSTAKAARAGFK